MTSTNRDRYYEIFWGDAPTENKMMIVGWFAQQRQGPFDASWLDYVDNVLKPLKVEATNLWKLEPEHQDLFCAFLDNSDSYGWDAFFEKCFEEFVESKSGAWGLNDSN